MSPNLERERTNPRRRRLQFSLATCLIAVAVLCFTLSRFYPRVYVLVRLDVGATNQTEATTISMVARSQTLLTAAVAQHPEIADLTEGDPINWLQIHVEALPTDDNMVEIRMSGFPKDRKRLQAGVDIVAEQLINFLDDVRNGSEKELAQLQKTYDEKRGEAIQDEQVLAAITQRIQKIQSELERRPAPPKAKVIERATGRGR